LYIKYPISICKNYRLLTICPINILGLGGKVKLVPFLSERLLSKWQNKVEYDFTESGVHPIHLNELIPREEYDKLYDDIQLRYIQTNGPLPLKESICQIYENMHPDNLLVTNASAEANFLSTWHFINPGDEIVTFFPNYLQVPGLVKSFGGSVKTIDLQEKNGWAPDLDELEASVSEKTKFIYLANPNNPTGAILSEYEMDRIVKIASRNGTWIIADEVYRGAELTGKLTPSFWGRYDRLLVVASLSKGFTSPGLRLGWVAGPKDKVDELWGYHDYTTITTNAISARIAILALQPDTRKRISQRLLEISKEQLQNLNLWIEQHPGVFRLVPPKIGGIAFVGYNLDIGSTDLVMRIKDEQSVLIVPGEAMGMEGFVRIGYGNPKLIDGLDRINETILSLTKGN
jgi:aspartate/methionine/tyrosine aminotransferase